MKARITISTSENGQLEIFLNEAGRDELVSKLNSLSENFDHFHLAPSEIGLDVAVSEIPYNGGDKIVSYGKVLFRPDHWDKQYFPHVLESE